MTRVLLVLLLCLPVTAGAVVDVHRFENPARQQVYHRLVTELRCLVCQNQNLEDSSAALAADLRQQVYDLVKQGYGEQEIIDYMVARYGDFVRYRPPFNASTLALWLGPFIALAGALWFLFILLRRRAATVTDPLSGAQRERLRRLLDKDDSK